MKPSIQAFWGRPRIELDYVAATRRSHWIGAGVLALACAAAGQLVVHQQSLRHELSALALAQGARDAQALSSRRVPKERVDEEAKQLESVVRQLALPWPEIVRAVESASMREVGVLNMQPDAQQRVLRITGEAKTQEAMLEYARRIGQSKGLTDVYLLTHQVQRDDPSRPIQFALQASFREVK
jgi:Tfp pilus assembly protein PilN